MGGRPIAGRRPGRLSVPAFAVAVLIAFSLVAVMRGAAAVVDVSRMKSSCHIPIGVSCSSAGGDDSRLPATLVPEETLPPTQAMPVDVVRLDVPAFAQNPELPTGCEATAVAMLVTYAGAEISKIEVADRMPYSADDPDQGYVGDPYSDSGWTIYPAAFAQLMVEETGGFSDLTGATLDDLRESLRQGKPVVCWVAMHGFSVHAIVVTGFDAERFYYNDPWTGEKDAVMSAGELGQVWDALDLRALSY
ncbi:hypothetical protein GCM10009785_00750 [Brooklawnia cerclae]